MPLFWIYFIPPGQVWQKRVGDWVGVRAPVAYMFDCRWGVGEGGGSSMWANAHSSPLNGVNGISYHRSLNS